MLRMKAREGIMATSMKTPATLALAATLLSGMPLILPPRSACPPLSATTWSFSRTSPSRSGAGPERPSRSRSFSTGRRRRPRCGRRHVAGRVRSAQGGRLAAQIDRPRRQGPGDRRQGHPRRRSLAVLGPVQYGNVHGLAPVPDPDALRADNPNMRLFLVPKRTADRPEGDLVAKWEPFRRIPFGHSRPSATISASRSTSGWAFRSG